ncbi:MULTISPECIES: hypothetical protein [Pseudoalteromonas]|uniref:hypothetical protein n=1 Tax=Pseudoalteromonas TaxID=53246 RepID=UPI0015816AFF|nr:MULTISPECIES: hypothetical protein [Pseudoalteromonas]MDI4652641.1 hypothetical protein [Pseudoalteromonas shioyasakiensis]NUJ38649.1 hypothetical protein [Pseudoalteromonas sp. 0303]
MDTNLEKVAVKTEILKHIAESSAAYFAINVNSDSKQVIDYLKAELSVNNVRVDAIEQCKTLPRYFAAIREELSSHENVDLMLVSHDLGWPLIELSHMQMDKTGGISEQAAIYASENKVLHGKPFYDDEIL